MQTRIEIEDLADLIVCAIRYCHGRRTYMPHAIIRIAKIFLKKMPDKTLYVLLSDCMSQERENNYGDEHIDKPDWISYRDAVEEEYNRRKKHEDSTN